MKRRKRSECRAFEILTLVLQTYTHLLYLFAYFIKQNSQYITKTKDIVKVWIDEHEELAKAGSKDFQIKFINNLN